MNRTRRKSFRLSVGIVAAGIAALLFAIGCGGGGGSSRPDIQRNDVSDVADVETPPDTADEVASPDVVPDVAPPEDVQPDQVNPGDVTPDVRPDVPPPLDVPVDTDTAPECTVDADCNTQFPGRAACEFPRCVDEACQLVQVAAPDCCEVAADCDDGNPLTQDACPVRGEACQYIDLRCTHDADCVDRVTLNDVCEKAACNVVSGECFAQMVAAPACCHNAGECDDGRDTTLDDCPVAGGPCRYRPRTDFCAVNIVPWENTFDYGSLGSFELVDYNPDDNVTWQVVDDVVYGGKSIYLGDPACGWYFTGSDIDENCETPYPDLQDTLYATAVRLELITDDIYLPVGSPYILGFWIQGQSEPPFPGIPFTPDNLVVMLWDTATGAETVLFETGDVYNNIPNPTYVAADISEFAGRSVRLRILFDTYTADANRYAGWWLDEMRIRSICGPILCSGDADCRDANGCSDDSCTLFANGDGSQGVCAFNIVPPNCIPCFANIDCQGRIDCQLGSCVDDRCAFVLDPSPACCSELDVVANTDFAEGMPAGWQVIDDGSDVRWQVVTDPEDGSRWLYFGNPATGTYDRWPAISSGRVLTPTLDLPGDDVSFLHLVAHWDLLLSTESDDREFDPGIPVDVQPDLLSLFVVYEEDGDLIEDRVWYSATPEVPGTTFGDWLTVGVDLSDYAGKSVRLAFDFNSYDENENNYGGVLIDNFRLRTVCRDVCTSDAACDDGDGCTIDACEGLVCTNQLAYPGCCSTVADCLPGNTCTRVTCVSNRCNYQDDLNPSTCCDSMFFEDTIEDGTLADYSVTMDDWGDPYPSVTWQATDFCALSPPYGLYFGDEYYQNYYTPPYRVSGSIVTPSFFVPTSGANAKSWVRFQMWLDTEWNGAPYEGWVVPPPMQKDVLRVYAVKGDQEVKVWDSYSVDFRGSTCASAGECGWQPVDINLTAYQGMTMQLRFEFDSLDDLDNRHLGVCIDDIEFFTACDGPNYQCFASEDCNDGDPCTYNFCDEYRCTYPPTGDPTCCGVIDVRDANGITVSNWSGGTAQGWEFTGGASPVRWQVSTVLAHNDLYALYFGNPETETYDDPGLAVSGAAYSPIYQLPRSSDMKLRFWYYLDIEQFQVANPNKDVIQVKIFDNFTGAERTVMTKSEIPSAQIGARPPVWNEYVVDISEFSGANVSFEVVFNSGDEQNNTGLGVVIDDWRIEAEVCPD